MSFFSNCIYCNYISIRCDDCHLPICMGYLYGQSEKCKTCPEDSTKREFPTRPHGLCMECGYVPVCHLNGICKKCVKPYHYVTENVAIGNCDSNYDLFDIVVNMDCPNNGIEKGRMDYTYDSQKEIHLIRCGIEDCTSPEYAPFAKSVFEEIHRAINAIKEHYSDKEVRILFHCFAGISRSVSAAIYYLSKETGMKPTFVYKIVKESRKIAKPNECFMSILEIPLDLVE